MWVLYVADAAAFGLVAASIYARAVAARKKRLEALTEDHYGEVCHDPEPGDGWVVEVFRAKSEKKAKRLGKVASDLLAAKKAAQHLMDVSHKAHEVLVIAGGGPVGCYCALSVLVGLREAGCVLPQVRVYDPTTPFRANCIYIPYNVSAGLPAELFDRLWPNARSLQVLRYCQGSRLDKRYYPKPDIEHFASICIKDFELKLTAYLEEHFPRNFKRVQIGRQEGTAEQKFAYAIGAEHDHEIVGFVCAAGGQGRFLRELPGVPKALQGATWNLNEPPRNHAFIVQWCNTRVEPFAPRLSVADVKANIGAFVCPNNERLECQLYCFPEAAPLAELFAEMRPSWAALFGKALRLSTSTEAAHLDTATMPGLPPSYKPAPADEDDARAAAAWFKRFRERVVELAREMRIFDSTDDLREGRNLARAKIYYAQRAEYHYHEVQAELHGVPSFFVGDAAGSTDFKLGLSGGRGLLGAKRVADAIVARRETAASLADAVHEAMPAYQAWWDGVVTTEFGQNDPRLNGRADILEKYLVGNRPFCD